LFHFYPLLLFFQFENYFSIRSKGIPFQLKYKGSSIEWSEDLN